MREVDEGYLAGSALSVLGAHLDRQVDADSITFSAGAISAFAPVLVAALARTIDKGSYNGDLTDAVNKQLATAVKKRPPEGWTRTAPAPAIRQALGVISWA